MKRESRMARERSEDAVTWNVFRSLDHSGQLPAWLASMTWQDDDVQDVVYWSYSTAGRCQWEPLKKASGVFGERATRGSEPDVIILTDRTLLFIEAKLDATNDTSGSGALLNRRLGLTNYVTGGDGWYRQAFVQDYRTVVQAQRYELLRLWLLGTWLAHDLGLDFQLVLLMREEADPDIHADFLSRINLQRGW